MNSARLRLALWLLSVSLSALPLVAQPLAFPGALGFGANATGGRGGTVYHVTTLADSGTGSFRDAVSQTNRIVVFDVGGYITLASAVQVHANTTIAGQTAPGGGIGFKSGEIAFQSQSNIICRFIRILPGSETASEGDDCLSLYRAVNIICDHVSLEFGPYNNIDGVSDNWQVYPVTAITFQNCIIADPSNYVVKDSTKGQQFGAHTECVNGNWSWFYNFFANSHNRNPLAKINTVFVNNVEYNCSSGYTTHTTTSFNHDIVNNYFIGGPASTATTDFPWFQIDTNQSIYYSGNLYDGDDDGTLNGSVTTPYWYQGGTGTILSVPWSSITATVPTYSPVSAYRLAVSQVGALPRDQVDSLVVSQLTTLGSGTTGTVAGTAGPDGGLYTSQLTTGLGNNGYGVINGGIPAIDSDGDGMPDYWEKAVGLNYLDASDATNYAADGYVNIEHYLNWLAGPHAQTATNTPVDVDLWQFTGGFTNASPVYAADTGSNGIVTLAGGHVAHFVPATNFYGLASFRFTVSASDGSGYTNTVSVVVVPQSQSVTQPSDLTWRGDGVSNLWAVGSGPNFFDGTNLVAFASGDNVTFDDTGSNTPAINLSGLMAAGTVYVIADNQDYTFGGSGGLAGATVLFKTGSGQLNLNTTNNYSGGTLIADGVVQIGNGTSANGGINGGITNNDTLIFATPGTMACSASISGTGTLTKNGAGALTLSGTQSYTNITTVNAGSLQFSGTIPPSDITNNGALIFAPGSSQIYSNNLSGPGSLTVNASGSLTLSNANTYAGGTTNAGGNLVLATSTAAGTGQVVYVAGSVMVGGGAVVTNDYSIPGSATIDLCMQATNGTGVWAGNVVNLGTSAQWRPGADTGGTLVFTGTAAQGAHNFIVPRGSVQFASNAIVSATGTATALGRDSGGNNRSANITLKDNAALTLGVCSLGGGQAGGSVTVTLQNNATLSCGANNFDLQNVNRTTAITTLRLNGGTMTVGGFTKTKTSQTNVIDFNGGVLKAGAANAAFLPVFAYSTNLVQAGGAVVDDGGFAVTIAAPLLHDAALGTTADGGLTKLGTGTLTLSGIETFTGNLTISNGILALASSASVAASGNLNIAAGTFDASAPGSFTLGSGRTVSGFGAVKGNFTVASGATLAPGGPAGALTFSNALTLAAGSTSIFEVGKSPQTNDAVRVYGTATLGGALVVTNVAGTFTGGETFKLVNAQIYSGTFSSVTLPALGAYLVWSTNQLNTAGIISVVNTAPALPVFKSLFLSNGVLYANGSNGTLSGYYYLLSSTNVALPMSNWMRLATNQFDGSGNFDFSNGVSGQPDNFFRLQLP